jgi:hypothetical protein
MPNNCNAIASSYGVSGKIYNVNTKILSALRFEIENHTQKIGLFSENTGKRLLIDETTLSNGEL